MSAASRAIEQFRTAMGDRPFVLVVNLAHPEAAVANLRVTVGKIPLYAARGLLATGLDMIVAASDGEPLDVPEDDEEEEIE